MSLQIALKGICHNLW